MQALLNGGARSSTENMLKVNYFDKKLRSK